MKIYLSFKLNIDYSLTKIAHFI